MVLDGVILLHTYTYDLILCTLLQTQPVGSPTQYESNRVPSLQSAILSLLSSVSYASSITRTGKSAPGRAIAGYSLEFTIDVMKM